jgi:proline iminopeptidase
MGGFDTAWELAQAWPDAELAVIEQSGHSGSEAMTARKVAALDRFAAQ